MSFVADKVSNFWFTTDSVQYRFWGLVDHFRKDDNISESDSNTLLVVIVILASGRNFTGLAIVNVLQDMLYDVVK